MVAERSEKFLSELKKLELEKIKKKEELEKLKQKINDATKQIHDQQEFEEKVPIDQVAALSTKGMSAEEKEILKIHKNLDEDREKTSESFGFDSETENKAEERAEEKTIKEQLKNKNLEESLQSVKIASRFEINSSEQMRAQHNYEAVLSLSKEPMAELYSQMKTIYDTSLSEGYVSGQIAAQTFELESAIEKKLADVDSGNYQFSNESIAKAASASLAMKEKVSNLYVSRRDIAGEDLYIK